MSNTYAVLVRADGKLLGRLTPEGGTTNRVLYAAMFTEEQAKSIAEEINTGVNLDDEAPSNLSAKVIKF